MRVSLFASLAFVLLTAGCGGKKVEPPVAEPVVKVEMPPAKRVDAATLPKLGEPLPALDGARLEGVAPLIGWQSHEADKDILARFAIGASGTLPRIQVTAVDAPADFAADVTTDNVGDFAATIATEQEGKALVEDVKPLIIGENAFARFVSSAKKEDKPVDRQQLVTQFDGRRYTVILDVWAGEKELKKHRDAAYAVAAGLKFVKPGEAKPAEEKSTEEKK